MSKLLKLKNGNYAPIFFKIEIDDDYVVIASHGTEIIARFEFDFSDENDYYELVHMDVHPNFQRLGIGKELMKYAVKNYKTFILPKPANFIYSTNKLTIEGAALVNYCFKKRILPPGFEEQYQEKPYDYY